MERPANVEAYLESLPPDFRAELQSVRETVRDAAPEAEETIAYAMPAFKYRGRPLVYYGAAKKHCAIYGLVPGGFEQELAEYSTDKGTIRFTPEHPLPEGLVRRLVAARMAEIDEAQSKKQARR